MKSGVRKSYGIIKMLGITDYIRNDLEGVYTAELFRGAISMAIAVILTQILDLGEARAYILIVALNGLRSMTGDTLIRRLFNIIVSLLLLVGTIGLSIWYGHNHLYIPQIITCIILSSATVYALARHKSASGTVMFMSVFNIVNFGMGLLDVNHEVNVNNFSVAAGCGCLCVITAVLAVPVLKFHWCLLINHCFYHDLRLYARMMSQSNYYDSFSDLSEKAKNRLLMLQSSLYNITKHVDDAERQERYVRILNGVVLITYWPTTNTDAHHVEHINSLRSGIFRLIFALLSAKGSERIRHAVADLNSFKEGLSEGPDDPFCNGEMKKHAAEVIDAITELKMREIKNASAE